MPQNDVFVNECLDKNVVGQDGEKIGKVKDVYLDNETRRPEWFAVTTGLFGKRLSFVPIADADISGDEIRVPYDKAQVKDSPQIDPDGQLDPSEEATLYRHYGLNYGKDESSTLLGGRDEGQNRGRTEQQSGGGKDTAMTRSEEELVAGKRTREAGRAKLQKYVETEHKQITVPVRRERVRVAPEPITGANKGQAMSGPDISEGVHEETLYEEEPVVEKRTVPKERVRLEKEQETEQREVGADLRKEQIRTEGDVEAER